MKSPRSPSSVGMASPRASGHADTGGDAASSDILTAESSAAASKRAASSQLHSTASAFTSVTAGSGALASDAASGGDSPGARSLSIETHPSHDAEHISSSLAEDVLRTPDSESAPKRVLAPGEIPQFFFPADVEKELEDQARSELHALDVAMASRADGVSLSDFPAIVVKIFNLPSFFSGPVFRQARKDDQAVMITYDEVKSFWESSIRGFDEHERLFNVLRRPGRDRLYREDFAPLMLELLRHHPGLEFLKDTPEFQDRYVECVIERIFYVCDRSWSGSISLAELRQTDFLDACRHVDTESDINKVLKYFSYEHFYVLYCKFWELDVDHDYAISRTDLRRFAQHALTPRAVNRVFDMIPLVHSSDGLDKPNDTMSFRDFVWFLLSEEDKLSSTGLRYWFTLCDVNMDGRICAEDMKFFYDEQLERMDSMGHEVVRFHDVLVQLADLIKPHHNGFLTLKDFRKCRNGNSAVFFNVLCNLNKFMAFEHRDPFAEHQERAQAAESTPWERFAHIEYYRLAMEEEEDEEDEEEEEDDEDRSGHASASSDEDEDGDDEHAAMGLGSSLSALIASGIQGLGTTGIGRGAPGGGGGGDGSDRSELPMELS